MEHTDEVKEYLEFLKLEEPGLTLLAGDERLGACWREMISNPNERTIWDCIEEARFEETLFNVEVLSSVAWSFLQIYTEGSRYRTSKTIEMAKCRIDEAWDTLRRLESFEIGRQLRENKNA